MRDERWKLAAACRDTAVDFFSAEETEIAAALECCAGCPVQEPCLDSAMRRNDEHGVWGGTTERQRRRIFRQGSRRRSAAA